MPTGMQQRTCGTHGDTGCESHPWSVGPHTVANRDCAAREAILAGRRQCFLQGWVNK